MRDKKIDTAGVSFEISDMNAKGYAFILIRFPAGAATDWQRVSLTRQWLQRRLPAMHWRAVKLTRIIESSGNDFLKICLLATKLETLGIRNKDNG